MKKVLALAIPILLTLSLFAACGEKNESESGASYGGGDDSGGAPPASNKDDSNGAGDAGTHSEQDIGFVKPSQLIPLENAKRIVHESLEYYLDKTTNEPEMDKAENPFPGFTISYGGDVFLILVVTVNYNESYIEGIKKDFDIPGFIEYEEVDDVGDWAAFKEIIGKSLFIGYKDIFINLTITGLKSVSVPDEDRDEILKELGRLACENYDALK